MITASVVTYFTPLDELKRLIDCVMRSSVECFYIVDNSQDEQIEKAVGGLERVVYIPSENLGFGHGHNIAMRKAIEGGADYHAVINPDTYWDGDVIGSLTDFMDNNPGCGLVMPKVLYPNGDIQYLCKLLPTPMDLFGRRFIPIKAWHEKHDYKYELQWTGYDRVMNVPSLSGCFMFMRVSVLEQVGLFDERYFMYAEDLDLCRRIGVVAGTMYSPHVSIYHEYGKGSYKNKKLLKYHIQSVVKYFNKWGWFFDRYRREVNSKTLKELSQSEK